MLRSEKTSNCRSRLLLGALPLILVGALITAGYLWRSASAERIERAMVAEWLPAVPPIEGFPPVFARRVEAASQHALEGPNRAGTLASLSALYHANGFTDEAMGVYWTWLELEPRAPKAAYRLATLLAGYGQADEAVPLLEIVIEEAPAYLEAHLQLADILAKNNRPDEAMALFQAVREKDPERIGAWSSAARVAMQTGHWEEARQLLEEATRRHPGMGLNWSTLATVYERLEMEDRMVEARWYAEQNTITGELPDPWLDELMLECFDAYRLRVAAFAYRPADSRDRDFALRLFERALMVGGDRALTHRHLGQTLIELGRPAEAREHLEKATEMAPDIADNWAHLIVACRMLEDAAAVERALFEGVGRNPRSPSLLLEQGRWFAARGLYGEAVRAFQASRRERPDDADAFVEIALVRFKQGRTEDGVRELRDALTVDAVHPIALTTLTLHAINTRDRAAADQWFGRSRAQPRIPRSDIADLARLYGETFGQSPG